VKAAEAWLYAARAVSRRTVCSNRLRSPSPISEMRSSSSPAILTSTSTRNATELRAVPMFVMNNTVLREVLLICTP
jgi:hypothetical protein